MKKILSFLGFQNTLQDALNKGAVIIDVRTAHQFDQGRIPGSINIPFDRLAANTERIQNLRRPIIICCDSSTECAHSVSILKKRGLKKVYYGGDWRRFWKRYKV